MKTNMSVKTNDLFSKLKPKFSKRQEGDGHEIEVEVREDEEQNVKLIEIINLLVAAGYFRARIKGLSPFDKVVGGMTWCIESCNVEVDVDLLFQENSTIGQKIALTEKIVVVLPKLQCPHPIEPHQIQGLDFIHIFPVIQWLVKRSMEFRTDTADFVYSLALNQFNRAFPVHQELTEKQQNLLKNIKTVNDAYRPQKLYRRRYALPNKDLGSKIQITLLDYDDKPFLNNADVMKRTRLEEHGLEQIMSDLSLTNEESFDYDEVLEENDLFNVKKTSMDEKTAENNKLENLKQKNMETIMKSQNIDKELVHIRNKISQLEEELKELNVKQREAEDNIAEMKNEIKVQGRASEVEDLIIESEQLKKQENEFKEECKKELNRLQNAIEEAKEKKSISSEADCEQIEKVLEEHNEKLRLVRLQVAKKSRIISILTRKIDDVPSRAELAQYQKRFIELYNQISAKHKETKQYYSLYNTLEDTRLYMKKELSLLNSVSDSYPEAMISREGKEEFLQQFINILEGVKQSKSKLDKRLSGEKEKRDELSYCLQSLIELNRKYVVAIKQLKLECQKNEELLVQLKTNDS